METPDGKSLLVTDLYKSFGERQVLKGVNLQIDPGVLMGFVGANGAGKTTTMRIVMGISGADRGTVTFGGNRIGDEARANIGYMPEERGLYPKMKVEEQLIYFARLHGLDKKAAKHSAETWMERLGVIERRNDVLEKLSLGNQQRVQLAAALVHDPQMLILDEPFSGLDPIAVDVMSGVLREYAARGIPVMFSSHQLALVEELCSHVAIISEGSIVASGEVEQLRSEHSTPRVQLCGDQRAVAAVTARAKEMGCSVQSVPNGIVMEAGIANQCTRQMLRIAVDAGVVTRFSQVRPTLQEIFRSVVEPERDESQREEPEKDESKEDAK